MEGPSSGGVRSVQRALATLEFLVGAAPRTVRVTDVALHLEVTPATASRLLATLVERGYASRTPDRRFTVGPASLMLAVEWVTRLRAAAAGPMHRVAEATGATVTLSQLLGEVQVPIGRLISIDRPPTEIDRLSDLALGLPLWATASGRALLGELPPAYRERLLPERPALPLTTHSTTAPGELRDVIRSGAKDRLHVERGEVDPDLWCCAVTLRCCEGDEILALAVVSPGEPTAVQRARIHNALRRESARLGGSLSA